MERKFESELGKRIQEGKKRDSTINLGIISAAVVSAALLVGSAVFLLPALAAENGKPITEEYQAIDGEDDYLIYVIDSQEVVHDDGNDLVNYDVRRIVNLKERTVVNPVSPYYHEYNLFVYNVNIVLSDLTNVGSPVDMLLGELTIDYPYVDETDDIKSVSIYMMRNTNLVVGVDALATVTYPSLTDQSIGIEVRLPDLGVDEFDNPIEYAANDVIQIQVSVKVPFFHDLYPIDDDAAVPVPGVVEKAFPDYVDRSDLPVADAGPDQMVTVGDTVTFDGSGSSDSDGTIASYEWTFTYDGNEIELEYEAPTFTFSIAGTYVVTLTVTDDEDLSDTDTVTITVDYPNVAPVADAGADQTVTVGDTVTFDGSGSSDSDGTIASYEWEFTYGGETKTFSCIAPMFVFKIAGIYDVTLTVTDNDGATGSDTVTITVELLSDP